jgi:dihydrofolate reductase
VTVRFSATMSLDGFIAGPNQSEENPLGEGGMALHEWLFPLEAWRRSHGLAGGEVNASSPIVEELESGFGAVVMGRNMFGPVRGTWGDDPWPGWWGDEPPYHKPVFVLTHHARKPLELKGGTTFHFIVDGIESALEQAREAAGDGDVLIAGGARTFQQYFAAALVDVVQLSVVPLLLGDGARLFENLGEPPPNLEQVHAVEAPTVTHLRYRVVR